MQSSNLINNYRITGKGVNMFLLINLDVFVIVWFIYGLFVTEQTETIDIQGSMFLSRTPF